MEMTVEQEKVATELFVDTVDENVGDVEGKRVTVRIDIDQWKVYQAKMKNVGNGLGRRRVGFVGATLVSVTKNEGARTPTGGRYVRIGVTVNIRNYKTGELEQYVGTMKSDTDLVKLVRFKDGKRVK